MKLKIKGLFILFFLLSSTWTAISCGHPVEKKSPKESCAAPVCLEELYFNHNTGCNCSDALNIRMNDSYPVQIPEWKNGQTPHPAAYIKNKRITVKAIFSAAQGITSAKIGAYTDSPQHLGDISARVVHFNKNGKSDPVYFDVSGKTPKEIKSFNQKWQWFCQNIYGSIPDKIHHIDRSENRIFIVLSEPQSPWRTSGDAEPWVEVLKISCCWAYGETTAAGAARKITQHLYRDIDGTYDFDPHYTGSTSIGNTPFDLKCFLHYLKMFNSVDEVNCADMGKALVTFSNIVGCGLVYELSDPFGKLRSIKPIGRDCNYTKEFNVHAFGGIFGKIFDATLVVCPTDIWMINIPWENYKKHVLENVGSAACPKIYFFSIQENNDVSYDYPHKKRLKWVKKKYHFANWGTESGMIISGAAISKIKCNSTGCLSAECRHIEGTPSNPFSIIRKQWKSEDCLLNITMVVCPTFDAAKKYLIFRYTDTSRIPPLIKTPGKKFHLDIGKICFVTPAKQKKTFTSLDFIRHNVLLMMRAEGRAKKKLETIARELDNDLLEKEPVNTYWQLRDIPTILHFASKKEEINVGERVRLNLEVSNPAEGKLYYSWEMSGGGIEKDCHKNFRYYGGNQGTQTITVLIINDVGLFCSKSLEIQVAAGSMK